MANESMDRIGDHTVDRSGDRAGQARLIRGLRKARAYPHPVGAIELIETGEVDAALISGDWSLI